MTHTHLSRPLAWTLFVSLILCVLYSVQLQGDWWADWAIQPHNWSNWRGFLLGPLLHGSPGHLWSNIVAVVVLGTLAQLAYPQILLRSLLLIWMTAFVTTWTLGSAGSHHVGISGITYGLMALLVTMAFLRKDRPAIAAALIVAFIFGGALWGFVPVEGISASGHAGGALGGMTAGVLFGPKVSTPPLHSWNEHEEEALWQDYIQMLADQGKGIPEVKMIGDLNRPD